MANYGASSSSSQPNNKPIVGPEMRLMYRLLSQSVQIFALDFENNSFHISTELAIIALRSDLTTIALNLSQECFLPNETGFEGTGSVTVNGISANYSRESITLKLSDEFDHSLAVLKQSWAEALRSHGGDLKIEIPEQCLHFVHEQIVLQVHIDVFVTRPKEGVKFVVDRIHQKADNAANGECASEEGVHVFTYRSNPHSSTKQWLPTNEHPSQLCVWRFEVTVPKHLTAICCGDLIDTIPLASKELKTFHYQLLTPTAAANIGFAIGDFQMYVQPEMPEIISFVLPQLMPLLKHTMVSLNRIFVFFEELLSCRFPYSTYWQVFVDQTPDDVTTYAGLSIFSLRMLYHKKILHQVQSTRQTLARAIAQQFFGCFISSANFAELWLLQALSGYLTGVFVERFFGFSEYMYQLQRLLKDACEYEACFGPITLRAKGDQIDAQYFDPREPETCSPLYLEALYKKGQFVVRMLERRLPKEQFVKVLQRVLSIGAQHSQSTEHPAEWGHLLLGLRQFLRLLTDVTGKEVPSFVEQWIDTGGHANFQVSHTFNRKRNIIELELRQANPPPLGCQVYAGPLTVTVQELEGHFVHTVQIDAAVSKHDIQCHSKGRKLKKKRILLANGEEVDVDLTQMDADSPVLWIRIDPELLLYRRIGVTQPFYQWEFLLLHERDVLAQEQAIEYLYRFPSHHARVILEESVRNEKFYYKIRRDAAHCLVHIYNSLPDSQLGEHPPLIEYFRQQYGCKTAPDIPQPNNYAATSSSLQNCLLLEALPAAIGTIRGENGKVCPDYVLDFLLNLISLNDNSANRYSDDYYRGALIHALGKALTMAERPVAEPEAMGVQAKAVLAEVTHTLNMDATRPSFGRVVSVHCLQVLCELQRHHHLPMDTDLFWKFGHCRGVYAPLRLAALSCIVALTRRSRLQLFTGTILRLLQTAASDPDPYIRYALALRLCNSPPFYESDNVVNFPSNTKRLAEALWLVISDPDSETRVRTFFTDLYFLLYGTGTPSNFASF